MLDAVIINTAIIGFASLMVWAAYSDACRFTIPNWIPLVMIVSWLAIAPFLSLSWQGFGLSILVFLGVLLIGMALWAPGWIGGGDIKLIAAGALWFGWPDVMAFIIAAALAGGALSIVLLGLRSIVPALPIPAKYIANTALANGEAAPYGIAIAAGALFVIPESNVFLAYAY